MRIHFQIHLPPCPVAPHAKLSFVRPSVTTVFFWQCFSNFPSSLHVQEGGLHPTFWWRLWWRTSRGKSLPHAVMDGFAGSAPHVPCPASVLFPDLIPAFQTKAVFFSQGAAVPGRKEIGNDRARACCAYPLPAGCWVNSASKEGQKRLKGDPASHLRRWERRAFSHRDDYIIPFRRTCALELAY